MIDAIVNFLQPSVRFFHLLHNNPFQVYVTSALCVAFIQWSSKKAMLFLWWLVNKGSDCILGGK
jgi:hypothetical protein